MKRCLALLLTIVLVLGLIPTMTVVAVEPLGCVSQLQTKWKDYYYGGGNLYDTGCGIFSLVNAVGYLTGQRMDVPSVASWAHSIKGYNVNGAEGTYRGILYPKVQAEYGSTYGFTLDCGSNGGGYWASSSSTTLKNHLANGGVAIGHVPGHFIALVGYASDTNKYHVYDSAPSSKRGTNKNGGDVWLTPTALATGKMKLDWFCLLSSVKDTVAPSISNIKITNKTATGYRVSCTVSDNVGVARVRFPTWTDAGWQDDLVWHEGVIEGNTAYFDVSVSEHNNEVGLYHTHIYVYDKAGNEAFNGVDVYVDAIAPAISNIKITNLTSNGYRVSCTVTDSCGIHRVQFPTWTQVNGQDDLKWYEGTVSGTTAYCDINITDFNSAQGVYETHIHAFDTSGNKSINGAHITVPTPDTAAPIITDIEVTGLTSNGYRISCKVSDDVGVTRVQFPTWTYVDGQDDLKWYEGTIDGSIAYCDIGIADFNSYRGTYETHIHAFDAVGNKTIAGKHVYVPIPDTTAPEVYNIKVSNITSNGYRLSCDFFDDTGVVQVLFPTWTVVDDQDDIKWYEGTINGSTAYCDISITDFNNVRGVYETHIHAVDNAGNKKVAGKNVTVPEPDVTAPGISNIQIINLSSEGYRVSCEVGDNVGVIRVRFPSWSEYEWQDHLVWHEGTIDGDVAYADISIADHNNERGAYETHIYAYDAAGNETITGVDVVVPEPDVTAPVISNTVISDITPDGYRLTSNVQDDSDVSNVCVEIWTEKNGQDDLIWYDCVLEDSVLDLYIPIDEHNQEGGVYINHIYAYDAAGNETEYSLTTSVPYELLSNSENVCDIYSPSSVLQYEHVPQTTGDYVLYAQSEHPVSVSLYNSEMDLISNANVENGTYNFRLQSTLNAGEKYIYTIQYNGTADMVSIPFVFGEVYTVSYNANGGTNAPPFQTKVYGTDLILPSAIPTRTGYAFLGWATDKLATTATYQAGSSFTTNADSTLYAVWKAHTYTVSYNANGGANAPSAQTKTHDVALTLSSTVPARDGYTFLGWATNNNATTAQYQVGASFTVNADTTLYAVWKANTYTVSYNANGGANAPSAQTKTHDVALTLSSTVPARDGYTFLGWATDASATTATYQAGSSFTVNADTTLYAVWEEIVVAGDVNGDKVLNTTDVRYVLNAIVGLTELTAEEACIADLNNDGKINSADVRRMLLMIVSEV